MRYPRPAARRLARLLWGRSLTPTTGVTRIPGLAGRVEIYRDARGVPHVEAADEASLLTAQGFCQAQDRLWQMEFSRRSVAGRLAEILGDRPLDWEPLSIHMKGYTVAKLDRFMRTMGLAHAAAATVDALPADVRPLLDAFVLGINRYIECYANRLPPEFKLLRYVPEPWTVADCAAIGKGMEFQLCFGWRTKLARAGIAARLATQPEKAQALDYAYPGDAPTILRYLGADATAAAAEQLTDLEAATRAFAGWAGPHAGSNNWVVSGTHTESGKPLLCNDPHLMLTAPNAWHQCHLKGGSLDVVGVGLPGLPGVVIGHNRHIAWGMTNVTADDADYYLEKINPKNPNQVKAGRSWEDLTVREEIVRVKDGNAQRHEVRTSRNGPLMSDLLADYARPQAEYGLSLKWTGHDPILGLEGTLLLNGARNHREFREACEQWQLGAINFVYADVDGNIAYQMSARLPRRPGGPNRVPVNGWEKKYQWDGYVPFDELPCAFNPPEGMVITANNKTVGEDYPHYISDFFEPPHRSQRIQELLQSRSNLTADDMRLFQFDTVSVFARTMVEQLFRPLADELRGGSAELDRAVDMLVDWDGKCHAASNVAPLFAVFHHEVQQRLFGAALGENLWAGYFEMLNECISPTEAIMLNSDNPWWDGQDRVGLIRDALGEAWWQCINRLGDDPTLWRWGELHGLVLPHALSAAPLMKHLFSIGPLPTGGDGLTVNNGTYLYRSPYTHFSGPSMRYVCNLADLADSWIVTGSGQSGNPLSRHYADQAPLWLQGIYQPMVSEPEVYRAGDLLVLVPDGAGAASGGNGSVSGSGKASA